MEPGFIPAYNYSIIPFKDRNENNGFDIYFFINKSEKLNCVRVENVYLSFLIHRIPGFSILQTKRFVEQQASKVINNDFVIKINENLHDSCYNILESRKNQYIQVFSKSSDKLRNLLNNLTKEYENYRKYRDDSCLDPIDRIIDKYLETIFRDTLNTTNHRTSQYWFCRVFDIPFIGYNQINLGKLSEYTSDYLKPLPSKVEKIYYLNANNSGEFENRNISKIFKKWDPPIDYKTEEMNKLTIASYDIETYNKDQNPDSTSPDQYIFCIGLSFFHLMINRPFKCFSIMTKDLFNDEEVKDKLVEVDKDLNCYSNYRNIKLYKIEHDDDHVENITTYIYVENEKDLVMLFVDILNELSPHVVTGFNNFTFDDVWIHSRVEKYDREDMYEYLKVFSTYDIYELSMNKSNEHLLPRYRRFEIKIEGKDKFKDNFTVRAPVIQSIDVYKMILKADAKRFSQNGKLDTMLDVYHIKNPYDGKQLSKTGLTIYQMFINWDMSKKLYEIAFYCLQDSWICATLIIERSNIIDKLGLATTTYTSFEDSIHKADGHRVVCTTMYFAYHNNFAFMDENYSKRIEMIENNWKLSDEEKIKCMGSKTFDDRTIVGGAVRNVHSYKCTGIVAADFSSMYPSQYRASNIASSTRVDEEILKHPEHFNLQIVETREIEDMYGKRKVYYIKKM